MTGQNLSKLLKRSLIKLKKQKIKYDAILAISRGGLVPGVILSHRLEIPNFQITIAPTHRSNEPFAKKFRPVVQYLNRRALKGLKKILIVDDIAGTGRTLFELIKNLKNQNGPKFDIFVVIKFKGKYSPPASLKLKFIGKTSKNWTVFPWEEQR